MPLDIDALILQIRAGSNPEQNKLEVKRQWPVLRHSDKNIETQGQMEFLKDLTALANTPGLEGHLVYGVDEKTGALGDGACQTSGLRDKTELYGLVVKHVDKPVHFELEEHVCELEAEPHALTIITIPPSLDKPHVIGRYISKNGQETQNYIPIRKGTGVYPANRSDIEFMFYDRKNIEPDYALDILYPSQEVQVDKYGQANDRVTLELRVVLSNYGRRPLTITSSVLETVISDVRFSLLGVDDEVTRGSQYMLVGYRPLIVQSNTAKIVRLKYLSSAIPDATAFVERVKRIRRFAGYMVFDTITGQSFKSPNYDMVALS